MKRKLREDGPSEEARRVQVWIPISHTGRRKKEKLPFPIELSDKSVTESDSPRKLEASWIILKDKVTRSIPLPELKISKTLGGVLVSETAMVHVYDSFRESVCLWGSSLPRLGVFLRDMDQVLKRKPVWSWPKDKQCTEEMSIDTEKHSYRSIRLATGTNGNFLFLVFEYDAQSLINPSEKFFPLIVNTDSKGNNLTIRNHSTCPFLNRVMRSISSPARFALLVMRTVENHFRQI